MSIPRQLDYSPLPSLPQGTRAYSNVVVPISGATFASNQLIQFNLTARHGSYLVPNSVYLRYTLNLAGQSADADFIGSFPACSPFIRLETLVQSQVIESITNYGVLNNMLLTCKMNYAQKVGLSSMFGIGLTDNSTALTFQNCNGHDSIITTDTWSMAFPLNNMFANADKLVPIGLIGNTSINLYTDNIANLIVVGATTVPTSWTLSNLELCYDTIEFNPQIDQAVLSMTDANGKICIKSQSYITSAQSVASGALSGTTEYIFSVRLASIKSLFLIGGGADATKVNRLFDSSDVTNGNGDVSFWIGGLSYPQRPISTVLNKSAVLAELALAINGSADLSKTNFSITNVEFQCPLNTKTTTALQMGKCYFGANTERLASNQNLMTGVSSQNSPISVRITTATASNKLVTLILVAQYDALIEIDPVTSQVNVLQ